MVNPDWVKTAGALDAALDCSVVLGHTDSHAVAVFLDVVRQITDTASVSSEFREA